MHHDIERLVAERGWRVLPMRERIGAVYDFVSGLQVGIANLGDRKYWAAGDVPLAGSTSAVLDRIKSARQTAPTEQQESPAVIDAEPQPVEIDHANAYADHCAAIEGSCDTAEWQQAYTTAWTWANETGDQNIIAGIKQIAGERKKQLDAGRSTQ